MLLAAAKSSGSTYLLFVIGALYVGFFFFYLRPRQKRNRAMRTQSRTMDVGDKVQTIGGLIGTVKYLDSHTITLQTSSGQELEFVRAAVQQLYVEPPAPSTDDAEEPQGDGH